MSDVVERLRRLYVQHGTDYVQEAADEIERLRDALRDVADLAGWYSDDDADANDLSPEDMPAHVNGLIRQTCWRALKADKHSF